MKFFLNVLIFLFSISAFATTGYKLKMDVMLEGKEVSTYEIIVEEGKEAVLTKSSLGRKSNLGTKISILATESEIQGNKGILLNLEIAHQLSEGKRIVTKPMILVSEGKEALFETSNTNGNDKFEMRIIANRIEL